MKAGTVKVRTVKTRRTIRRIACGLLSMVCGLSLLSACGGQESPADTPSAPAEEMQLSICTSLSPSVYEPIVREFEARTGIWVTVENGGSLELLDQIAAADGAPSWDLLLGGGMDSLTARSELFVPYESPLLDHVRAAYLPSDNCETPFSIVPLVLIYNPKLARIHPPSGFESLLDTAWKGRIAFADPTVSGTSYTVLAALQQVLPGDDTENLRAFAVNLDRQLLSHSSDVIREVANGNCYIGMVGEDDALRAMEAGYDIAVVYPAEGTCAISDGAAILKGCAHEENAALFIDFLLSLDVQKYIESACLRRSVMDGSLSDSLGADSPTADSILPDDFTDDFSLFSYDIALSASSQEDILRSWRQIWEEESR